MNAPWPQKIAYTFDEAVLASGVSRRALQYAIRDGRLKSYFAAGRRRIFPKDLEDYLRGGPPKSFERVATENQSARASQWA
jgi:hypothetical protein